MTDNLRHAVHLRPEVVEPRVSRQCNAPTAALETRDAHQVPPTLPVLFALGVRKAVGNGDVAPKRRFRSSIFARNNRPWADVSRCCELMMSR